MRTGRVPPAEFETLLVGALGTRECAAGCIAKDEGAPSGNLLKVLRDCYDIFNHQKHVLNAHDGLDRTMSSPDSSASLSNEKTILESLVTWN
jgi:hypothetical protein